jgi:hypothetical protein
MKSDTRIAQAKLGWLASDTDWREMTWTTAAIQGTAQAMHPSQNGSQPA